MKTQRVSFSTTKAEHADIVGFATMLASIFGNRQRGLACFLRLTPEYQAWRCKVEWCPHCRSYAPIVLRHPDADDGHAKRLATYADHSPSIRANGHACPGSGRQTKWIGDQSTEQQEVTRKHILHRIAQAHPSAIDGSL